MKRLLLSLIAVSLSGAAVAAGGAAAPYTYEPDATNTASLQRGATDFMASCSGCHGLKYLRYNRLAADLGIPEDLLQKYLMVTTDKPGDHIVSAMPQTSADWFGQPPPDRSDPAGNHQSETAQGLGKRGIIREKPVDRIEAERH